MDILLNIIVCLCIHYSTIKIHYGFIIEPISYYYGPIMEALSNQYGLIIIHYGLIIL
jgi:hypothetical protein